MSAVHDGRCSPWVMCSRVSGNQIHDNVILSVLNLFLYEQSDIVLKNLSQNDISEQKLCREFKYFCPSLGTYCILLILFF